jgi:hypothetical protein
MVEDYQYALILINSIVAIFAIWKFRTAFNQRTNQFTHGIKIESAKFLREYNAKFIEKGGDLYDISRRIGLGIPSKVDGKIKQEFKIKDDQDRNCILNYLSELESVSIFYKEGIITIEQLYEAIGNQILDTFKINTIVDVINTERDEAEQVDLFDKLEATYYDLRDYQKNKTENITKSTIPYYDVYIPKPLSEYKI